MISAPAGEEGLMDDRLEAFAQKAGEAFVAAGRAATPEQRMRHRACAGGYQHKVSKLRLLAGANSPDPGSLDHHA